MQQGQCWVSKVHELQGTSSGRKQCNCRTWTGELLALAISLLIPEECDVERHLHAQPREPMCRPIQGNVQYRIIAAFYTLCALRVKTAKGFDYFDKTIT